MVSWRIRPKIEEKERKLFDHSEYRRALDEHLAPLSKTLYALNASKLADPLRRAPLRECDNTFAPSSLY